MRAYTLNGRGLSAFKAIPFLRAAAVHGRVRPTAWYWRLEWYWRLDSMQRPTLKLPFLCYIPITYSTYYSLSIVKLKFSEKATKLWRNHPFLLLISNVKNPKVISSNFCGFKRIHELYKYVLTSYIPKFFSKMKWPFNEMKFNINSNTFVNINRLLRTYILNNRKHLTQFVKATAVHSWDSKNINLLTNTQETI